MNRISPLDQISRVNRSTDAARIAYNRLSRWYDWLAGSSESSFRERGLEMLHASAGESVLEVGCGTGQSLAALSRLVGTGGRVYGLDLSDGMLEQARKRLLGHDAGGSVVLLCGDAEHLPFPAGAFDALFLSFTLELFDTPVIPFVLDECNRILKPGGRMSVVSLSKAKGAAVATYEWFHMQFPSYVDCRPIPTGDILSEAGFSVEDAQKLKMWGLSVDVVLASKKVL